MKPAAFSVTIDDKEVQVQPQATLLDACKIAGVDLPLLCYFEGLKTVGACRLCLVEVEGSPKLFPACATPAAPKMKVRTATEKLLKYRRMTLELFFSERNHMCAVCVANNNCDLQKLAQGAGMNHVRFPYLVQDCRVDASHAEYVMDHNRCIMCTRCVRVCDEVEGAHNWDVLGRGVGVRITSDFNQPWGESTTCTSCGKCLQVCPTGALWPKGVSQGQLKKHPQAVSELALKRKKS